MAIVSDVEIRLRADIARLQQDLNGARRGVSNFANDTKKLLAGAFAGFSIAALAGQVIAAQRQFDKLNASLVTATGSSKAAGQAFGILQDFAAKTPFSLQEVTGAFLKLRNMGLTPSERALTSYGNTASGMGKDLNQMIEAVADAATGEFERLKEFGIKAKQQGDQVSLTFQGTTTKVGNNAKDIEAYLMALGEVNFAGGMARQANSLDGDLSNLGDAWDQTLTAFSQSGFGDVVRGGAMALSSALGDLIAMFKAVGGAADEEGKKVEEIGPLHAAMTTIFETLMVLGVNVAYVFNQVGKEIGGLAAQAVAVAKGDFAGARFIGEQMRREAEEDRKEVDAKSAAILGAAAKAQAARAKEAADRAKDTTDRLAQYKIQANGAKALTDAEIKEAARRAQVYRDLQSDIRKKITESGLEADGTRQLNDAEKMAIDITEQLRIGKLKLTEAQQGVVKGLVEEYRANLASAASHKAYKKMLDEAGTLEKELADKRKEAVDAAKAEVKANEELVATFGMTEAAVARLELARLKEQLAQRSSVGMTLDEIENLEQLIALKEKSAAALANVEALKETQQFWTDIEKTAHDTFLSIADGGKNMWQRLKESAKNMFFDWLYQMTVRKWIINVGASFSGTAGVSGIAGAADTLGGGGGSSMGGMASYVSAGQAIYKGFATGFASVGTGIGTYVSALGNTMGSSAVSAFGSGMGLTSAQAAEAAAAYNAAGMSSTGSAISAGSAAGSAVGTVAGVAAGAAIGHYGGRAISNGYSVTGGSGNSMVNTGTAVGAGAGMIIGGPLGAAVGAALGGLIGGLVNRAFGHKAREYEDPQLVGSLAATGVSGKTSAKWLEKGGWFSSDRRGVDTKEIDQEMADLLSGGYNAIQTATLNLAGVFGVSADVLAGYSKSLNFKISKDAAENEKMLLELFTSIGDDMAARVVPDIAKFKREGETVAQTLERLAGEFQVVDGVLTTLGATSQEAFGSIGVASIEARSRLLALSGGVEAMAAQAQYFADNFLTTAQQIAPAQQLVARELSAMGYAQVNSVEQYRAAVLALVESGALATDEGARTYAKLMSLAPAFKTVTDAAVEAGRAQADAWLEITERSVNAQKDVVTKAYDDAMAALELRIDGVNATIERTGELSRALRSALGTVESSAQQEGMRAAAQAQITAALAIAKAGGALPTADDLRDALAALGRDASGQFDSLAAYQREVARTNNELIALGGISDGQLDTAERQLRAMQEYGAAAKLANEMELARLDTLYATARAQVGALSAANTTLTDISNTLIAIQANNVGIVPDTGGSLASELERQQRMSGGTPVPSYTPPSATTNSDAAMLAALQSMEARMANVENNTMRAATATTQFASQFDLVSAGGNAIATEVVS